MRPPCSCCTASRRGPYLYRTVIADVAARAYRVVAPDLIGFGRSDKHTGLPTGDHAMPDEWFLCAFSDGDPITRDAADLFVSVVPGARGMEHPTIRDAAHFLQEDAGRQLADVVATFADGVYGRGTRA